MTCSGQKQLRGDLFGENPATMLGDLLNLVAPQSVAADRHLVHGEVSSLATKGCGQHHRLTGLGYVRPIFGHIGPKSKELGGRQIELGAITKAVRQFALDLRLTKAHVIANRPAVRDFSELIAADGICWGLGGLYSLKNLLYYLRCHNNVLGSTELLSDQVEPAIFELHQLDQVFDREELLRIVHHQQGLLVVGDCRDGFGHQVRTELSEDGPVQHNPLLKNCESLIFISHS